MLVYYLLICQKHLTVCHIVYYWLNLRHMASIYLLAIWSPVICQIASKESKSEMPGANGFPYLRECLRGPSLVLCYLIYSSTICTCSWMSAPYTTMQMTIPFLAGIAPTIDAVISNLQSDGNRAIKWFTDNGMQANPEKFQFMMISRDEDSSWSLTLNDSTVIVSEDHVKVLGVVIDSKLSFSLHVSAICNKTSRQLNALARISNYLDVSARRTIYDSFVASNFNYCPLVWHFCGATNNSKLEKIQERCLRIIYKDYESPYETLLETTNTTSLVVSRLRLILLEVYKSLHQLNAKCINGLFEVKSTRYSLRNPVKVLQPKKKTTTYGLKSISYTGAKLWNDLFPILSNNVELDVFKASLKILDTDHLDPTFTYV